MSHPQPPQRQPTTTETNQYVKALHNTALVAVFACPVLALLPPRKLDFYTFGLGGATIFSANFLLRERTGRSIWQHIRPLQQGHDLPQESSIVSATERANLNMELQQTSAELRRIKDDGGSVAQQVRSQRDAWKAQREKEIRDDLEEGKGYQDMILDQIWEVWNWGKPKDEDDVE